MDTPSNSSQPNSSLRIICRVCGLAFPQLTCPRCSIRYCSPECYESHKLHCPVSFPPINVLDKLRLIQPDNEPQRLILDLLEQQITEAAVPDSDSDSESCPSEKAAEKILSEIQLNLDDLSLEEQKKFKQIIAQPWKPWWLRPSAKHLSLSHNRTQLVQPLKSNDGEGMPSQTEIDDIPPGPDTPLPSIRQVGTSWGKGELPPLLEAHLIDIIYSYCFTLRLFNGDWKSDCVGAFADLVSVSSVWDRDEPPPETVSEVLSCCLKQTNSFDFENVVFEVSSGLLLIDDVVSILNLGREAIICLLCDLQRMIEAVQEVVKSDEGVMTQLKPIKEKVYLFMCWANEQTKEVWDSLALLVKA